MTDKIEEITKKIYNEGVVKAKEDAGVIVSEAKAKAEEILKHAQKQKAEILAKAQGEADEIKKNAETELQLASRQFISTIKQRIIETITAKQTEDQLKKAFEDNEFVRKMMLTIIKNWNQETEIDLRVLLPQQNQKELNVYFDSKALEAMDKSVVVNFDPEIESGFKIGPKDGGYIISFTDEDFMNYFKHYLKERTRKLLFDPLEEPV